MSEEPSADELSAASQRRSFERYRLALSVTADDGSEGVSRDVSAGGVYFVLDQPLVIGAEVSLSIALDDTATANRIVLHCRGLVRRVENANGLVGIAAEFTSYTLDRNPGGFAWGQR